MKKGDMLESRVSEELHKKGVPALISSVVLRSLNLGQIDVAYLELNQQKKWVLKIIETKFSLYPSKMQMLRLLRTQDYLSRVLEVESKLEVKFCQKADHSLNF
jgi:hypothetical protein